MALRGRGWRSAEGLAGPRAAAVPLHLLERLAGGVADRRLIVSLRHRVQVGLGLFPADGAQRVDQLAEEPGVLPPADLDELGHGLPGLELDQPADGTAHLERIVAPQAARPAPGWRRGCAGRRAPSVAASRTSGSAAGGPSPAARRRACARRGAPAPPSPGGPEPRPARGAPPPACPRARLPPPAGCGWPAARCARPLPRCCGGCRARRSPPRRPGSPEALVCSWTASTSRVRRTAPVDAAASPGRAA